MRAASCGADRTLLDTENQIMRIYNKAGADKSSGFTLIELLVVVAIIALLIAMLLPALGRAKQMANMTRCKANLKGMGTAILTYSMDFDNRMIPGYMGHIDASGSPLWYTNILANSGYTMNNGWKYTSPVGAWGDIRTGIWRCPTRCRPSASPG